MTQADDPVLPSLVSWPTCSAEKRLSQLAIAQHNPSTTCQCPPPHSKSAPPEGLGGHDDSSAAPPHLGGHRYNAFNLGHHGYSPPGVDAAVPTVPSHPGPSSSNGASPRPYQRRGRKKVFWSHFDYELVLKCISSRGVPTKGTLFDWTGVVSEMDKRGQKRLKSSLRSARAFHPALSADTATVALTPMHYLFPLLREVVNVAGTFAASIMCRRLADEALEAADAGNTDARDLTPELGKAANNEQKAFDDWAAEKAGSRWDLGQDDFECSQTSYRIAREAWASARRPIATYAASPVSGPSSGPPKVLALGRFSSPANAINVWSELMFALIAIDALRASWHCFEAAAGCYAFSNWRGDWHLDVETRVGSAVAGLARKQGSEDTVDDDSDDENDEKDTHALFNDIMELFAQATRIVLPAEAGLASDKESLAFFVRHTKADWVWAYIDKNGKMRYETYSSAQLLAMLEGREDPPEGSTILDALARGEARRQLQRTASGFSPSPQRHTGFKAVPDWLAAFSNVAVAASTAMVPKWTLKMITRHDSAKRHAMSFKVEDEGDEELKYCKTY
ncbi:hypothetical protein BDZ90DRAFT_171290 [Jaminaea rosea]|uniref:Uncharacterized protein n=1 Tax=Jaminaea rosea TaxID=1569628 RepID=A0A316UR30_9BASI|nr:hypothetical protein BDZ90DRAFT_171290 [Jaminaea rosea]PWN27760.1 hypothetical protein BDZ90DRAFT_171290 [Jaminaea rosea]